MLVNMTFSYLFKSALKFTSKYLTPPLYNIINYYKCIQKPNCQILTETEEQFLITVIGVLSLALHMCFWAPVSPSQHLLHTCLHPHFAPSLLFTHKFSQSKLNPFFGKSNRNWERKIMTLFVAGSARTLLGPTYKCFSSAISVSGSWQCMQIKVENLEFVKNIVPSWGESQ